MPIRGGAGVIPSEARNLAPFFRPTYPLGHLELRPTVGQSEIPRFARNGTTSGSSGDVKSPLPIQPQGELDLPRILRRTNIPKI